MPDITEIIASCKRELQALKADKKVTFEQLTLSRFSYTVTSMIAHSYYTVTARCHAQTEGRIPIARWSADHAQMKGAVYPSDAYWMIDHGDPVLTIVLGTYNSSNVSVDITVEGFNLAGVDFSIRKSG